MITLDQPPTATTLPRTRPMEPLLPQSWSVTSPTDDLVRPTIHVVDDDRLLRDTLKRMLTRFDCEVAAHESSEHFLQEVQPDHPQCLVLDLGLPGMSGIELLAAMHRSHTALPTLVLSSNDGVESVVRSIQSGAIDFLPKPPDVVPFVQRIEKLLAEAPYFVFERRIAARVANCVKNLSPRESQAYALMIDGNTPKQVARELGLRPRTAHIHCSNVLTKFGVETPNDLLLLRARLASGPFAASIAPPA